MVVDNAKTDQASSPFSRGSQQIRNVSPTLLGLGWPDPKDGVDPLRLGLTLVLSLNPHLGIKGILDRRSLPKPTASVGKDLGVADAETLPNGA